MTAPSRGAIPLRRLRVSLRLSRRVVSRSSRAECAKSGVTACLPPLVALCWTVARLCNRGEAEWRFAHVWVGPGRGDATIRDRVTVFAVLLSGRCVVRAGFLEVPGA